MLFFQLSSKPTFCTAKFGGRHWPFFAMPPRSNSSKKQTPTTNAGKDGPTDGGEVKVDPPSPYGRPHLQAVERAALLRAGWLAHQQDKTCKKALNKETAEGFGTALRELVKSFTFRVLKTGKGRLAGQPNTWFTVERSAAMRSGEEDLFTKAVSAERRTGLNVLSAQLKRLLSKHGGIMPSGTQREDLLKTMKVYAYSIYLKDTVDLDADADT